MRRWSGGVLVMLVVSTSGCAEMIVNTLTRSARFERACLPPSQYSAFADDPAPQYRAYEGPTVERQEVAVVVVPQLDTLSEPIDPHYAYWIPRLDAIDGHRKVLGPDRKTRNERLVRIPDCCLRCAECLRVALMPGTHVMDIAVSTQGSVSPDRKWATVRGVVQFSARPGGLYSLQACAGANSRPVFWARDERTLACVSTACP